ncbi:MULTISPECIES: acyl carrier protein [unclassified Streptomyces]|uniref:Acyl carrier protein n=1 Tax=Streptomyces sp. R08 TaxID=3238624 RepID=A0AB39MEQ1_9ACTN|nr:acyl carrier protein [Streptomyces sp. NBC_00696]
MSTTDTTSTPGTTDTKGSTRMTLDDVKKVLVHAVAAEAGVAPAELATDRPFTDYGLDSMAALSVGMEIEDVCGLADPPVDLLWDHPTVDTLAEALWKLMNAEPVAATAAADGLR